MGYGATDDVTLAGGMPLVGSLETIPFWVAPKVRVYDSPMSQVSTGVFAVHMPGETEYDWETSRETRRSARFVGIAYGVGSFGDVDNALHAGAGVSFGGDGTQLPLMVGGELRVSRRNKLISENWLIPGEGGAVSGGVRMMGERWTTDLGLMALAGDGTEIPYFPIVSFSYAFGSSR